MKIYIFSEIIQVDAYENITKRRKLDDEHEKMTINVDTVGKRSIINISKDRKTDKKKNKYKEKKKKEENFCKMMDNHNATFKDKKKKKKRRKITKINMWKRRKKIRRKHYH